MLKEFNSLSVKLVGSFFNVYFLIFNLIFNQFLRGNLTKVFQ
ncbi:hypothetical protein HSACCH_00312 [Halanaerobium saccharolyticum subsp. saccharolyticum DSM 6643]|uniref:Uncharacterized protein n=1 Tax=Halanaerobium saccharolyticum subsp. saccharolyticum DSM 6643 TaxID=1293054 RepID=M5DX71_9FIRM|nr:hypothetical protein HSACCH_00312 [Halanaerobium saccharolyticum subsp. saccharolyticum DSM 6643]